jgi:hypothetical protein
VQEKTAMAPCISSIVTALVLNVAPAATPPPPPSTLTHTRALTRPSAELIETARTRVPCIRAQLEALERSDIVVYVGEHFASSATEPSAHIRFVGAAGGKRYLKVTINRWKVPEDVRLEMLGHELQHALEIAAAPQVRDDGTLVELYRRIGFQVAPRQFETSAARAMEGRVRGELWGGCK